MNLTDLRHAVQEVTADLAADRTVELFQPTDPRLVNPHAPMSCAHWCLADDAAVIDVFAKARTTPAGPVTELAIALHGAPTQAMSNRIEQLDLRARAAGLAVEVWREPLVTPLLDDATFGRLVDATRGAIPAKSSDYAEAYDRREALLERLGCERSARVASYFLTIAENSNTWVWLCDWGVREVRPVVDAIVDQVDANSVFHALSVQARLTAWERTPRGFGIAVAG
jgi:hypothetical protein